MGRNRCGDVPNVEEAGPGETRLRFRFTVARRSPPYRYRDSRTANRPAAYANRERESRGRIVAPFRQGQAQPDGGTPLHHTINRT
jgi:hypothetical protein